MFYRDNQVQGNNCHKSTSNRQVGNLGVKSKNINHFEPDQDLTTLNIDTLYYETKATFDIKYALNMPHPDFFKGFSTPF